MLLAGQTSPTGPPHLTDPGIVPVMTDWLKVTNELIEQRRADPQGRPDLVLGPHPRLGYQARAG